MRHSAVIAGHLSIGRHVRSGEVLPIVSDLMSKDPVVVKPRDTLRIAIDLILLGTIRHLPVVDPVTSSVVGIITDRDIKRLLPSPLLRPLAENWETLLDQTHCSDVMTKEPITIQATDDLSQAIERMMDDKIGCLPVIDRSGHLVGILTQIDMLRGYKKLLQANVR